MTIYIPTPLRPFAAGQPAIEVDAATVAQALDLSPGPIPTCASISSPPRANSAPLLTCI